MIPLAIQWQKIGFVALYVADAGIIGVIIYVVVTGISRSIKEVKEKKEKLIKQ
jgi:hypothetical protein